MTRRYWQWSLWLGLGAALFGTAYLFINTTFMLYDDEGYLLLTLRNFLAGGRLYDEIFSQYGPWPYVYHQLVTTLLHQPLTHLLGRNLTALHWVVCAGCCGLIVARTTGRLTAAVFTTLATFSLLWQMSSEPSHPGSLISAMVASAALFAVMTHDTGRWTWLAAGLGTTAALLVLTKINVGLLFVTGLGVGALRLTAWPARWQRPAEFLAAAGLIAVPWVLMFRKLDDFRVLALALQFSAAAAGLLWVTPSASANRGLPPRTWLVALGFFCGALGLVCLAVCAQGTSLAALIQTVLFDPLRQPASFLLGVKWVPAVWPVTAICWLTTARAGWELRRHGAVSRTTRFVVLAVRLATALAFIVNAGEWLTVYGVSRFIVFCLPLLPVFLVPLVAEKEKAAGRFGGGFWLAAIALPQVLHAYPVAGSQMGWGTFLFVPLLAVGLNEAWLASGRDRPPLVKWIPLAGWGLLAAVSVGQIVTLSSICWDHYRTSKPLELPGAENIRVPGRTRVTLRVMTLNAAVHADVLFSRPGMFSYNLWSGVPPPTPRNATHWFWLLNDRDQAGIIAVLRATPRSAVIVDSGWDDFLTEIKVPIRSPLRAYIEAEYRSVLDLKGPHFLVPRESRAVPFGKIDLRGRDQPEADGPTPVLLRTNVLLAGPPAAIQLQGLESPWATVVDYHTEGARMLLEPITAQGDVIGPAILLPAEQAMNGLYRLSIFTSHPPAQALYESTVLVVRAPDGTVLSESLF